MAAPRGKPFPPGNSANPGGRPKKLQSFQQMCREEQGPNFERLKKITADPKHKQQMKAIELMIAYDLGRPIQTQNVRVIRSFEDLSEEELQMLAGMGEGDDASVH
jgi:hypothetical protein